MPNICPGYLKCFLLLGLVCLVQIFLPSHQRDTSIVQFSMTTLQYYCEYIYVPYLGGGGLEDTVFLFFFPFQGIHYLLTLQSLGLYLIRQRLIVLASLAEVPAMNKGISKVDSLRAFSESTKRRFASVLAVA